MIKNKILEVEAVYRYAKNQLNILPVGTLQLKMERGRRRYICAVSGKKTYLGKNNENEIKELEKKNYFQKIEECAKKQKECLNKMKKLSEEMPDYKLVFMTIPKDKRHLITPYEYLSPIQQEQIEIWKNKKKSFLMSNTNFVTQNKEIVKSKSELIIADKLLAAEVPYIYENPVDIICEKKTKTWHPDFTVLNKKTGQQFLWEHFGLMDNPEYCANSQYKLEIYAQNGYFPGKNLIISSECSLHVLNTKYIDILIEEFLL